MNSQPKEKTMTTEEHITTLREALTFARDRLNQAGHIKSDHPEGQARAGTYTGLAAIDGITPEQEKARLREWCVTCASWLEAAGHYSGTASEVLARARLRSALAKTQDWASPAKPEPAAA